ncbi:MAG TPA: Uma2 family endonuclease [Isosphaeraceae bacterium]|jgi:Uma2 family endonuclease|nr:Uma2 family endonuclease [Isosphaeraceae bacterium]
MATVLEPIAPASGVDESLYEVVDGQYVEMMPMGAYSGEIASILSHFLGPFAMQHGLGKVVVEVLFLIDPARNRQRRPDLAFVSARRWPSRRPAPDDAAWEVVPDLCVEVVSPTDRAEELLGKVREYFEAGAEAVWVVYPKERVVHILEGFDRIRVLRRADTIDGGALLPGFRLPLSSLFEDEEPPAPAQA